MLAPDARVVLLDQLRPPQGYQLDAAVATTFTLGLGAALVPPLAFAGSALRGGADPISVLAAVKSCTDRVDVFCQAGMISVPARANALFAYLEPMVHEVKAPAHGLFHPKLWLLRFTSADLPVSHRLLVLSRNLTDDHAWDVSLRLDGTRQAQPRAANAPLGALIRSLPDRVTVPLPADRQERVLSLAEDARRIDWEHPESVDEIAFHVFGVPGHRPDPDFSGARQLIVSPFLDAEGLDRVSPTTRDVTLVSRVESLEQLPRSSLDPRPETYIVSAVAPVVEAGDAGSDAQQGTDLSLLDGLHAKVYVVERNRVAHLFLGSTNATSAGFTRNVELLVELVGPRPKIGVDRFLDQDAPFRQLLEPYAPAGDALPDPEQAALWELENAVRRLADQHWVADVSPDGATWRLTVTSERAVALDDGQVAAVELLTMPGTAHALVDAQSARLTFAAVPLVEVTPFLVLRVADATGRHVTSVLRAELRGDPSNRLDAVLASQVDTTEKFLRFLALLLGLGAGSALVAPLLGGAGGSGGSFGAGASGVFETLVKALAHRPAALGDLERLIGQLRATEAGSSVLPPGFGELWSVVQRSRAALRAGEPG